jgi:hypothetical protein
MDGIHHLSPPWESPFIVSKALDNNSYYLIDIGEQDKNAKSEEESGVHGTSTCFVLFTLKIM